MLQHQIGLVRAKCYIINLLLISQIKLDKLDKINKFKLIFDIHHRITAKFILRCYQLRKESL